MTNNKASVQISGRHDGQIVTPRVEAILVGSGHGQTVHVRLWWHDQSERVGRQDSAVREFRGELAAAEQWLESEGVTLGAQGIH